MLRSAVTFLLRSPRGWVPYSRAPEYREKKYIYIQTRARCLCSVLLAARAISRSLTRSLALSRRFAMAVDYTHTARAQRSVAPRVHVPRPRRRPLFLSLSVRYSLGGYMTVVSVCLSLPALDSFCLAAPDSRESLQQLLASLRARV